MDNLWGTLTLLSMAPMMLGPWHCRRLSWLTGCWRIRFFTISRNAATLFLSSLPSERRKIGQYKISGVTGSHIFALQSTLMTFSYLRMSHKSFARLYVSFCWICFSIHLIMLLIMPTQILTFNLLGLITQCLLFVYSFLLVIASCTTLYALIY